MPSALRMHPAALLLLVLLHGAQSQSSFAVDSCPGGSGVVGVAAYEYDARDAVGRSLDAWMRLLGPALGRSPNRTIVRDYLLSTGGGRTRAPHALSIYNYEAVEAALQGTRYAVLLRRTGNEPTVVDHVHRWWNVSAAAAGVRPSEPIAKAVLWSTLDDFRVRRYRRFENKTRRV